MQLNTRALFSLIPAAFIVPLNDALSPAPRADGYVVMMKVTSGGEGNTVTLKMAGEKMRLEGDVGGSMGSMGNMGDTKGAFLLPTPDGKIVAVMPNMQNPMGGGMGFAVTIDVAALAGGRRGAPPVNVTPVIEDLGAGEKLIGHATRKYRIKDTGGSGYMDIWLTTDLKGLDFRKFVQAFGKQMSGSDARTWASVPEGFPLKTVTTSADNSVTTMEVLSADKKSFAEADFEVPAGIQVLDLGGLMGGRGRGRGNQ
jgi:hypothetical protein